MSRICKSEDAMEMARGGGEDTNGAKRIFCIIKYDETSCERVADRAVCRKTKEDPGSIPIFKLQLGRIEKL